MILVDCSFCERNKSDEVKNNSLYQNVTRIVILLFFIILCFTFKSFFCESINSYAGVKETVAGWESYDLFEWDYESDDWDDDDDDWDDDDDDWDDDDDDWDDDDDDWYDENFCYRKTRTREFNLDRESLVMFQYKITPDSGDAEDCYNYVKKGNVKLTVLGDNDEEIYTCKVDMANYEFDEETNTGWFYTSLKEGHYKLRMKGTGYALDDVDVKNDIYYSVDTKIVSYSQYAENASIKKKVSKRGGYWVKIGKFGEGLPFYGSLKYSNKKVTNGYWIKSDGSLYIYARKKGKSTVTVKLKNGKQYKCKVTVQAGEPDFYAYVKSYKTRGNYFEVRVKNVGVSNLYIKRNGSKATDKDYKSYDRKLKGGTIKIKPGKSKTVRFYVKGRTTWPKYKDFTIHSKFSYEGRTYKWRTRYYYSEYKLGKKWLNTYWDEGGYTYFN